MSVFNHVWVRYVLPKSINCVVYIEALRPEFELKHYYNFLIYCLYIVMFFTPCHIGKQQKTN